MTEKMQKRLETSEKHKRFKQLVYLKSEIEVLKEQLLKLNEMAEKDGELFEKLPNAAHITRNYAEEVACLTDKIGQNLQQRVEEYNYLVDYILAVPDSMVRQVFILKFAEGLSYEQIAKVIGGPNTPGGLEVAVRRQLKGHR